MYIVKDKMDKRTARILENALICIYTLSALANARHEIALKNLDGFNKEIARASSVCRMPLDDLKKVMERDYK